MTIMVLRRRSLLLKFCIALALVWLGFVLFIGRDGVAVEDRLDSSGLFRPRDASWGNEAGQGRSKQPVIERPDLDRLRFEQAMRKSAEEEAERRRQAETEKERLEEERRRRLRDRVVPPFMNMGSELTKSPNATVVNGVDLSTLDEKMRSLVEQGLIVPKWNLDKEYSANPNGTGEFGVAVDVVKENLSAAERKEFDDGWQRNAFNQYASDRISLHRSLPDVRDPECKALKYREKLPQASVIIIFHNEAWTVLLRTVHSVLDRSPTHLVKEVILVDDFSDFDHLKKPLDDYVSKLVKVRVMRGKKREGLIRARLLGASVATAEVLIFLDSHCECAKGWLEPLLDRIAENRSNVVAPIIDVLDDGTLKYQYSSAKSTSVGGFDWNLQFNWHAVPDREKKRRKSDVEPVWSPTMAGGLFGISREYFEYLGTYDPGMDIWGGENLELSFRIWMCGGILEQVMCSHVGHIFRHRSPYAWRSGTNVLKKNSIRLAEVWMDDYKKYFYERFNFDLIWMCGGVLEIVVCSHVGHIFRKRSPYKWRTGVNVVKKNSIRLAEVWMDGYGKYYYERFNNDLGDYGDVTSRKELRKKLQCKTFDWYLKNVFPELFIPGDALASGTIQNKAKGTFSGNQQPACVDSAVDKNANNKPVKLWPCHNQGGNQYWMLSKDGEIRRDEGCIDFAGQFVMIYPCHGMKGNQEWAYGPDNTLRHKNTNLCLQISDDGTKLDMKPCTGIDRQIWYWRRKTETTTVLGARSSTLAPNAR